MKILEKEFRKRGFFHEEVFREKDIAIYKRWRTTQLAQDPHYEVVIIKYHDEYKLGNAVIEAGESYPGGSTWGILGWTLATESLAREKVKWIKKHRAELEEARKSVKDEDNSD